MEKVVLVSPLADVERGVFTHVQNFPIGLISIASYLKEKGADVRIIDCEIDRYHEEKLIREAKDATYVGFSITTMQIASAIYLAQKIRNIYPELLIVFGGIHSMLMPEQTLEDPLCDIVCCGEGEEVAWELVRLKKGETNLSEIGGIGYKNDGKTCFTSQRRLLDLDKLPMMNYDVVNIEKYYKLAIDKERGLIKGNVRRLSLHTARGCPYRCSFCVNTLVYQMNPQGKRYRSKSAERVLYELEYYKKRYNINFVSFGDDLFFADKQRVDKILKGLKEKKLNIKWYANIRADFFRRTHFTRSYIKKMIEAGCIRLTFGAESGSNRILKVLKKDITAKDLYATIKILKNLGLSVGYSFMVGIPGEKSEDLNATMRMIESILLKMSNSYVIGPQIYRPYPGSEIFSECVKKGFPKPQTLRDWAPIFTRDKTHSIVNWEYAEWVDDVETIGRMKERTLFLNQKNIYISRFLQRFFSR